ncbi:hypothetical protein FC1_01440 [Flavobacterium columnare NBRC 100251 = ATCC 23463]|nr:hypothetical protein FC1_01440 [Flavobacterium columnare NBRC 100251 = ATCC 23463]
MGTQSCEKITSLPAALFSIARIIIKGVKGTGMYLNKNTKAIEITLKYKKHFHKNNLTLVVKVDDGFLDFVFVFVLLFMFFFVVIYIKSANSCPIKLPMATPIPPIRTPQKTFVESDFTIGFL